MDASRIIFSCTSFVEFHGTFSLSASFARRHGQGGKKYAAIFLCKLHIESKCVCMCMCIKQDETKQIDITQVGINHVEIKQVNCNELVGQVGGHADVFRTAVVDGKPWILKTTGTASQAEIEKRITDFTSRNTSLNFDLQPLHECEECFYYKYCHGEKKDIFCQFAPEFYGFARCNGNTNSTIYMAMQDLKADMKTEGSDPILIDVKLGPVTAHEQFMFGKTSKTLLISLFLILLCCVLLYTPILLHTILEKNIFNFFFFNYFFLN